MPASLLIVWAVVSLLFVIGMWNLVLALHALAGTEFQEALEDLLTAFVQGMSKVLRP